jgi:hypothetical protein
MHSSKNNVLLVLKRRFPGNLPLEFYHEFRLAWNGSPQNESQMVIDLNYGKIIAWHPYFEHPPILAESVSVEVILDPMTAVEKA